MDDKSIHDVRRNQPADQENQTQEISNSPHDPESSAQPIQTSAETPPHAPERQDNSSSIQNGNTANGRTDSEVPAKGAGGPRTERGKKKSSRNAIKHGIFSSVVLHSESSKEYRDICHALCDYLKPDGRVELIIVEKLAANL